MLCCPTVRASETIEVDSSASSAILYEPTSGRVLFEKNAHIKRPMASTTKLMTALVAAETLAPSAMLCASAEAVAVEGSNLGLRAGDMISCEDLLYGLLLSSGNDAANVFALTIGGSYEAFAQRMNNRAAEIGMTRSHFVTPSGLDADGHGASAYDMALLAAEVLGNERLARVCATREKTIVVGERTVSLTNHNRLLSTVEGCVGMKTGYTSLSGRCLVSAATRHGVTLIAVTLDCANDWEEHQTLLEEGFSLLDSVVLPPLPIEDIAVFGGKASAVAVSVPETEIVRLRSADPVTVSVKRKPFIWAPVQAGDVLGTAVYTIGTTTVAQLPIKATDTVEELSELPWFSKVWSTFCLLLENAVNG